MNGRFRAASAVYPLHSCVGLLNFLKAVIVALPSKTLLPLDGPVLDFRTICAFCLRTSAGVRMKQETSSPVEEAIECTIGVGKRGEPVGSEFRV